MNPTDKKISRDLAAQISKSTSHVRALVETPPEGLRTEIVTLVNLWDFVWDMRNRDGLGRSSFRSQVRNAGASMAIENREKDREWNLPKKEENTAKLLVARAQMAVDAAEAFIDYWAGLKTYDEDKAQTRSNFVAAMDELLKGTKANPVRLLIRGDEVLSATSKISLLSRPYQRTDAENA